MPRTGSSMACVTSARSLSSAQLRARSRLLIFDTSQMFTGSATNESTPMIGLRMTTSTPRASSSGSGADEGREDAEQLLDELEVGDATG